MENCPGWALDVVDLVGLYLCFFAQEGVVQLDEGTQRSEEPVSKLMMNG